MAESAIISFNFNTLLLFVNSNNVCKRDNERERESTIIYEMIIIIMIIASGHSN